MDVIKKMLINEIGKYKKLDSCQLKTLSKYNTIQLEYILEVVKTYNIDVTSLSQQGF